MPRLRGMKATGEYMFPFLIATAVWLLASPRVSPFLYKRWLFRPGANKGDAREFRQLVDTCGGREVWFYNCHGNRLRAWLLGKTNGQEGVILYSMGNDGDIARRTRMLAFMLKAGLPVFVYEYAGFGASAGTPSLSGVVDDGRAAFDFITAELNLSPKKVILFGESLGGAVSAALLDGCSPGGIILKSTFSSLRRIARDWCPILRAYPGFMLPNLNTKRALAAAVDVPVLILHGWGDRMINWRHAKTLYEATKAHDERTLVWLSTARHAYMEAADELRFSESVRLFSRLVSALKERHACEVNFDVMADLQADAQTQGHLGAQLEQARAFADMTYRMLSSLAARVPEPSPSKQKESNPLLVRNEAR
jgi:fermentation-respiration switch protein FrsA (DUF1100 family)